jgi:hypothetical protein
MPATPLRAQLSDQELLRRMYARPAIRCSLPDPAATAQALALPSAGSRLGSAQPAGNSAHGLDVRAMNRSAATQYGRAHGAGSRRTARWWWRQLRLDALPQRIRQESIHKTGHAGSIPIAA